MQVFLQRLDPGLGLAKYLVVVAVVVVVVVMMIGDGRWLTLRCQVEGI